MISEESANAWVGLRRIKYASPSAQQVQWFDELNVPRTLVYKFKKTFRFKRN